MSAHESNYSHAQGLRATIFDMAGGEQRKAPIIEGRCPILTGSFTRFGITIKLISAVISEGDADPAIAKSPPRNGRHGTLGEQFSFALALTMYVPAASIPSDDWSHWGHPDLAIRAGHTV